MKTVFFLAALANVVLFMWEYNKGAFERVIEKPETAPYSGQGQIVLVSELNRELPGGTRAADFAEEKDAVSCYEAGPFANEKQLGDWRKQLTDVGADIIPFSRDGQSVSDYVVYYPAAATLEQSEANLQMLKSRGLVDVWMLRKGDEQGQISLGIFNKEERALLMKDQMQNKGIKVEVKPRYKNKMQKYARIKGGDKLLGNLKVLEKTNPGIKVKPVNNCSEF